MKNEESINMYEHSWKEKEVQPPHLIGTICYHLVFIEFCLFDTKVHS